MRRRSVSYRCGHCQTSIGGQQRHKSVILYRRLIELVAVQQPHSPHSRPRRVRSACVERHLWHHLAEAGWVPTHVLGKPAEVVHDVVEMRGEKDPLPCLLDLVLNPGKVPHAFRDYKDHATELSQESLKFRLWAQTAAPGEGIEQLKQSLKRRWGRSSMVPATVSISQPWTTLTVSSAPSHLRSFLTELRSFFHLSSFLLGGQKSSSTQ